MPKKSQKKIVFTSPNLECQNPRNLFSDAYRFPQVENSSLYVCMNGLKQLGLPRRAKFRLCLSTHRTLGSKRVFLRLSVNGRVQWGKSLSCVGMLVYTALSDDLALNLPVSQTARAFYASVVRPA